MEATASELRETVCNLFAHTLGVELVGDEAPVEAAGLHGCVHVIGRENLVLMVSVNEALSRRSARAFLESDDEVAEGDLPEVFAELVNVIAGHFAGIAGDAQFTLPVVSASRLHVPNSGASYVEHLRDDGRGRLAVALYPGVPFVSAEEMRGDIGGSE